MRLQEAYPKLEEMIRRKEDPDEPTFKSNTDEDFIPIKTMFREMQHFAKLPAAKLMILANMM